MSILLFVGTLLFAYAMTNWIMTESGAWRRRDK